MIKEATMENVKELSKLFLELWPKEELDDMKKNIKESLSTVSSAIFIEVQNKSIIGFAECSLRTDYVEGTSSSPVGYLEGIYVQEEFRHQDIGTNLLSHCEAWAKKHKCKEFASDAELLNSESIRFHFMQGFKEANRIVCFTKEI